MFPLGGSHKADVRAEADRLGLAVADKPDSHDVCFIPDGDTAGFLRGRLGERPGAIVDAVSGKPVGAHSGAYGFTVGQRKGLRIGRPAPDGRARYVLGIEPVGNTVTVGPVDALGVRSLRGVRPRWCGPVPAGDFRAAVQVRAHGDTTGAWVRVPPEGGPQGVSVELDEEVRGVAPGQAAAFYDGTRVVGSVTITATA
jgi:tRNA-specific 2-thiouridylase